MEYHFHKISINKEISKRVIFTEIVAGDENLNLLARGTLFCLPSRVEGISNAVLEALSSAMLLLLQSRCHFLEVKFAKVGKFVSADPYTIASLMKEFWSCPEKLPEMGQEGLEFVKRNYTLKRIIDRLIDVLNEEIERYKQRESIS